MASQALLDIQAQLKKELEAQTASFEKSTYDPTSIKLGGKKFSLPSGVTSDGPLTAIILDWRYTRKYFPEVYNSMDKKPPVCFASNKDEDLLEPNDRSTAKQSDEGCNTCKWDVWGSAEGMSKGKRCKNGIALAIVPVDPAPKKEKGTTPWLIDLPPSSIKPFLNFVRDLGETNHLMPLQVKVDLQFEPRVTYPLIQYANATPHPYLQEVVALRDDAQLVLDQG
jgi:hypothetical protein